MAFRHCPHCGTAESEVLSSSMLGCAHCYTVFFDLLSPLVWKYQGSTVYHGKHPKPRPSVTKARSAAYQEALERAQKEGRLADVEVLKDLLNLLRDES